MKERNKWIIINGLNKMEIAKVNPKKDYHFIRKEFYCDKEHINTYCNVYTQWNYNSIIGQSPIVPDIKDWEGERMCIACVMQAYKNKEINIIHEYLG